MPRARGLSLVEALVWVTLAGIVLAVMLPATADLQSSGRAAAGARRLALAIQAQRWNAVAHNRSHGLFFFDSGGHWSWYEVADGNGNGLRTTEVRNGTDTVLSGPHRLEDRIQGVRLGFLPGGGIPRIPPNRGTVGDDGDPVRFGRSDLVSFSPLGSASSGTLYVTDGKHRQFGVVLFGPTARVRVWRYDDRTGQWTL
jgi:hypothetical protein